MKTITLTLQPHDGAKLSRSAIGVFAWLQWLGGKSTEDDLARWADCSWYGLNRDLRELVIARLIIRGRKEYGGSTERCVEILPQEAEK